MSHYIAKKVRLASMKGCMQQGCSCFTQNGYYIQYRNRNVDSILFVCDRCYEEKFKSICSIGDFDEEQYIVRPEKSRYYPANPLLRNMIRWTRQTARVLRVSLTVLSLILLTAFCIKEHPCIRTEFTAPQFRTDINTDIHFTVHNLGHLKLRTDTIANQLMRVFTHGGINDDQQDP